MEEVGVNVQMVVTKRLSKRCTHMLETLFKVIQSETGATVNWEGDEMSNGIFWRRPYFSSGLLVCTSQHRFWPDHHFFLSPSRVKPISILPETTARSPDEHHSAFSSRPASLTWSAGESMRVNGSLILSFSLSHSFSHSLSCITTTDDVAKPTHVAAILEAESCVCVCCVCVECCCWRLTIRFERFELDERRTRHAIWMALNLWPLSTHHRTVVSTESILVHLYPSLFRLVWFFVCSLAASCVWCPVLTRNQFILHLPTPATKAARAPTKCEFIRICRTNNCASWTNCSISSVIRTMTIRNAIDCRARWTSKTSTSKYLPKDRSP